MNRKRWRGAAVAMAAALALTACSGGSGSGGASGEETVELTLMTDWLEDDPYTEAYYSRYAAFQEAYPHIKLKMDYVPYAEYTVKLQTLAAGDQLPDVMQVIRGGSSFAPIARAGLVMPIDELLADWEDLNIPQGLMKDFTVDGKTYAVPAEINYTSMIFYNKKLLRELGYDEFPQTFSGFLELIDAANAKGMVPIVLGNKSGNVLVASYLSALTNRIGGNDLHEQILEGKKKFTDPEFIQALETIKTIADHQAFNKDANSIETGEATDRFIAGQSLMYIDGNWVLRPIIDQKAEDFEVGFAWMPPIEGGRGEANSQSAGTYQGLAINAKLDGKKKEAAETFVKFVYSEQLFIDLLKGGGLVTATVDLPSDLHPDFQEMIRMTSTVESISSSFEMVMPPNVAASVKNNLQGLIMGDVDPRQMAEEAQQLLQQ